MNGVIAVDKPAGFTSFDVIAKLRGILKERRIGHSGTLDPLATGVLVVFVGKATRAADMIPDQKKRYTAEFKLGAMTDTQDRTGEVVALSDRPAGRAEVLAALKEFQGKITQLPPMYSAIKVGGRKLYDLARQGKIVERAPREVEIFGLELKAYDEESRSGVLDVVCSKGTYIRTLIDDLGRRLGTYGMMTELRRTYSQGFDIKSCATLEEISAAALSGSAESVLTPVDRCFEEYEKITLSPRSARLYKNGVKLLSGEFPEAEGLLRVYSDGFLGIARAENGELRAVRNFFEDGEQ